MTSPRGEAENLIMIFFSPLLGVNREDQFPIEAGVVRRGVDQHSVGGDGCPLRLQVAHTSWAVLRWRLMNWNLLSVPRHRGSKCDWVSGTWGPRTSLYRTKILKSSAKRFTPTTTRMISRTTSLCWSSRPKWFTRITSVPFAFRKAATLSLAKRLRSRAGVAWPTVSFSPRSLTWTKLHNMPTSEAIKTWEWKLRVLLKT